MFNWSLGGNVQCMLEKIEKDTCTACLLVVLKFPLSQVPQCICFIQGLFEIINWFLSLLSTICSF